MLIIKLLSIPVALLPSHEVDALVPLTYAHVSALVLIQKSCHMRNEMDGVLKKCSIDNEKREFGAENK